MLTHPSTLSRLTLVLGLLVTALALLGLLVTPTAVYVGLVIILLAITYLLLVLRFIRQRRIHQAS